MFFYYLLTQNCNLSCSHCIRGKSETIEMTSEQAFWGLNKLHRFNPEATLVVTGGEPSMHHDILQILDYALNIFKNVIITSNGTSNIYHEKPDEWLKLHYKGLQLQFSVDGVEDDHNSLRGRGTYNKVLSNLKMLSDLGIPMWVSTVVTRDNIDLMEKLKDVLTQLNIVKWHINQILPFGCGSGVEAPSRERWNLFVDTMLDTCQMRLGIKKLYDFSALRNYSESDLSKLIVEAKKKKKINCGSGNQKIYIYPDFSIYGCTCSQDFSFGNLVHSEMCEILSSSTAKKIREYRVDTKSPCFTCSYYPLCNGGCIGMSLYAFGRLGMGDNRCPLWQKKFESIN